MKYRLKVFALLFFGIITGFQSFAQTTDTIKAGTYRTWSIGVSGGISTPYTLIGYNSRQDFTSPDIQEGYSIDIKKQLSYSFGLQADVMAGKLQADHAQPISSFSYSQFDTKLNWAASLSGNFIVAHIYGKNHHGIIQPYLTFGAGAFSYTPVLHQYNSLVVTNLSTSSTYFIPIGGGFKFDLTRGINLDIGYQVNFAGSDDVDGYKYGPTNDRFSYTHIGLEFALGKKSKPQMASVSRLQVMRGEYMTREQQFKNTLDAKQRELDATKVKNTKLSNDLDATNANLSRLTADSDGDGVPDVYDKCPNTPAGTAVDGSGCPLPADKPSKVSITDQDKQIVSSAGALLEFYPGKAIIREYSHSSLDKVARLLMDKGLFLKLESYTDNTGDADSNLKLSKAQAEAVKGYLVNKGVNASHITTFGYGDSHPIANNKTPAGRRLNRRVEFTLY